SLLPNYIYAQRGIDKIYSFLTCYQWSCMSATGIDMSSWIVLKHLFCSARKCDRDRPISFDFAPSLAENLTQ
ncbi:MULTISPECIES: hypothetical protein, partial [unclassified Microcoleus]|uniref:hypothetical protein n=1 Tax=unclassified Microcoleus TaxID=2642155 RepID=UPI002FD10A2B